MNIYAMHNTVSFYLLLLIFHLQITHRKVRNLQISVDKLVRKVLIKILLPYGGKLWQQENLVNSLHEYIGGRKFGKL